MDVLFVCLLESEVFFNLTELFLSGVPLTLISSKLIFFPCPSLSLSANLITFLLLYFSLPLLGYLECIFLYVNLLVLVRKLFKWCELLLLLVFFYDKSYYFYFVLVIFYVINLFVLTRFLDIATSYDDYLYFFSTREFFNVIKSKAAIFYDSIFVAWLEGCYFYNERP